MRAVRQTQRRGATAVEFAMTFPVLAILLLITVEYGWYFSQLAMVQNVTVEATRFAANQPSFLAESTAESTAVILFNDMEFDCATLGCAINATMGTSGLLDTVELEVEVPYEQLTGILPSGRLTYVIPVPTSLRGRAILPVVGP